MLKMKNILVWFKSILGRLLIPQIIKSYYIKWSPYVFQIKQQNDFMYPTNSFFRFIRLCVFESRDHKPSNSSRIYIRTFIVFGIYRLHSIVPVKQSEVPVCRRHAHFYQHKDFKEIDYGLSKEISNVCKSFVDKKLSVHFGEDKIKYIFFSR